MFHMQRRGISRIATVMLASSLVVGGGFALAGTAAADDSGSGSGSGVSATLESTYLIDGEAGQINVDGDPNYGGGLYALKTADGKVLKVYCIDVHTDTQKDAKYQETGWDSSTLAKNEHSGQILWILQNSYPVKPAAGLLSGTELTDAQAAAGTQAAIWQLSDGVKATPLDEDAAKLTKFLLDNAKSVTEPKPSLSLTPPSVSGKSGDLLGPITVNTSGASVDLSVDDTATKAGLVLTDKDGKVIKTAVSGDQIFAKAPAGAPKGTATITASTSAPVAVGRAFTGVLGKKKSQTMILAGSEAVPVTSTATAAWAPAGTGPIPAISAAVDCKQGAVVVTATNSGDQDFTFTLAGQTVTVKPGATQNLPVHVDEGQSYNINVTGLAGKVYTFSGVLNCKVATGTGGAGSGTVIASKSATPAAGTTGGTGGGKLATTGGGGETPLLAGIAGALVLLGGGAVFAMRRRGRHGRTAA